MFCSCVHKNVVTDSPEFEWYGNI